MLPVAVLGIYPTNCCLTGREENRLPHYDNESEENRRARRIP
ncbi:aconitate hydratase [Escherichia coli]|nr:aconitate hydratase [Escherichia coli]